MVWIERASGVLLGIGVLLLTGSLSVNLFSESLLDTQP